MKKIWTFLRSFKRKLKLSKYPERKPDENLRKKWKKNQKNLREIKLIKLTNRKKENLKFRKIGKEFKEKLKVIWRTGTKLFQNKFWAGV